MALWTTVARAGISAKKRPTDRAVKAESALTTGTVGVDSAVAGPAHDHGIETVLRVPLHRPLGRVTRTV